LLVAAHPFGELLRRSYKDSHWCPGLWNKWSL